MRCHLKFYCRAELSSLPLFPSLHSLVLIQANAIVSYLIFLLFVFSPLLWPSSWVFVLENNKSDVVPIMLNNFWWLSPTYRIELKLNQKGHTRPLPIWLQSASLGSLAGMLITHSNEFLFISQTDHAFPDLCMCCSLCMRCLMFSTLTPLQPGKLLLFFFDLGQGHNFKSLVGDTLLE